MAIEKMKLVNIVGPLGLFDQVVRGSLVDSGFAPESVLDFVGSGGGLLPFTLRNPNGALLSRSENLLDKLNIDPALSGHCGSKRRMPQAVGGR